MTPVVTIAAVLGAALRRRARKASWMKKRSLDIRRGVSWVSWPLVPPSAPTPISAFMRRPNSVVDSSV